LNISANLLKLNKITKTTLAVLYSVMHCLKIRLLDGTDGKNSAWRRETNETQIHVLRNTNILSQAVQSTCYTFQTAVRGGSRNLSKKEFKKERKKEIIKLKIKK